NPSPPGARAPPRGALGLSAIAAGALTYSLIRKLRP
ncbi:HAD-IB family hydrolase, partial [Mycobacteroides abscessus subsp. abscessus]|nr:HAD-IB family hydrolase [Mycobacteroides abscessus subsp. abscessus]